MLNERGAYWTKVLDDGRVIDVIPLTFGRARLLLSESVDAPFMTDGW
jgi:hypothetical protein